MDHKYLASLATRKRRAFAIAMARGKRIAALYDPATGGNEALVHNWGSRDARAAWKDTWAKWYRLDAAYERRYRDALLAG